MKKMSSLSTIGWHWHGPHPFPIPRCSPRSRLLSLALSSPAFICCFIYLLKENIFPPRSCFPLISLLKFWFVTRTFGNNILESYPKIQKCWRRGSNCFKWVRGALLQIELNMLKNQRQKKERGGGGGVGEICRGWWEREMSQWYGWPGLQNFMPWV